MKNWSIRLKISLWFSLMMILVVGLAFLLVRGASEVVLRSTIRDYLISAVEENADKIRFVTARGDLEGNMYIPIEGGLIEIDVDFMEIVNDVHMALYEPDGTLLYGENPLSKVTSAIPFSQSYTWNTKVSGVRYDLYDRKLSPSLTGDSDLYIRGIVPETKSAAQLKEITRISLILLPALILFSILLGYLLIGRMLRPLEQIEATAHQITKGDDLKKRLDVGKGNDEVARLGRSFNEMLDQLEGAFETERRFTSDASHELRTPTSVILAQTEYTLEKPRDAEEYREALGVVKKQANRMSALIGDMLDYTRMDQKSENYPMDGMNLSILVSEVCDQMAMVGQRGIELKRIIEEGIYINGNKLLVSRLLQNLISNGYRYGKEGGELRVMLRGQGANAILSVSDDGIGMDEADIPKIFDRFYRSDASRSIEGTGLGLSMVKKIADLHGAKVEVESELGKGSTFRIIFSRNHQL